MDITGIFGGGGTTLHYSLKAPFFRAKCHFSRNGFQLMCSLGYIVPWTLIASIGLSAREVMGDGNDGSLKNIKKHGLSQSSWRYSYGDEIYA